MFANCTGTSKMYLKRPFLTKSRLKLQQLQKQNTPASGGLRPPDPLTRGSAHGPRWGLRPQTPHIGSRSRARHVAGQNPENLPPNIFAKFTPMLTNAVRSLARSPVVFKAFTYQVRAK
jgi:hypothetical protein